MQIMNFIRKFRGRHSTWKIVAFYLRICHQFDRTVEFDFNAMRDVFLRQIDVCLL